MVRPGFDFQKLLDPRNLDMHDGNKDSRQVWGPLKQALGTVAEWNDERFVGVRGNVSTRTLEKSYSVLLRHWWRLGQEQQYRHQLWQESFVCKRVIHI